jgi:NitT/TauT family transport system ATP-binding protein
MSASVVRMLPERPSAATGPAFIKMAGLGVAYETRGGERLRAVDGFDMTLREGEFCVIVGPSGCGKSTVLKVLAGLVRSDQGTALIAGEPAGQPRSDIGFVFQSATLLPWSTVRSNVLLPLKVQRRGERQDWDRRADVLLDMVGLSQFSTSYPFELSGGMQQRVGLARALVHDPRLLLMDEPFGALDAFTRETMNAELQRVWMLRPKTVVFVTHSIAEAVFLADRVIVMSARPGRAVADFQVDLPRPRTFEMVDTPAFAVYARQIRGLLHQEERS